MIKGLQYVIPLYDEALGADLVIAGAGDHQICAQGLVVQRDDILQSLDHLEAADQQEVGPRRLPSVGL